MFIPYPGSEFFHPGSGVQGEIDYRSGSAYKNLSIFNLKICFYALGNMIRDVHFGSGSRVMIFYLSRVPDLGVKKSLDLGSRIRIRSTVTFTLSTAECLRLRGVLPMYFIFCLVYALFVSSKLHAAYTYTRPIQYFPALPSATSLYITSVFA
jgi:hypothetical protein